ncbi:MAG: hypothetical protein A2275_16580 [Bacteroidetes bacterium RIFOXYA12_FULL_35_11]|nr:MAG: hypothetical protein A2X01_11895 [Bacteroidetes bacterium GWF2_35_48]OFY72371.1 MAG: hypothetical protein A2275_16580 [Bacteroidetes bacterium RIFOXYA12_FULL_35_11]OFZ03048.1 MAG: hypothetical protein A2491_01615 [Bacteroidetes bacterium RIFOXYC12_FULL_35_7]
MRLIKNIIPMKLYIIIALTALIINARAQQRVIFFNSDKYELRSDAITTLDRIIEQTSVSKNYSINLIGHTDNTGSYFYNQKLSQKRANAVYEYLISKNILDEKIQRSYMGEAKPIASNERDDGKKENRRVEVFVSIYENTSVDLNRNENLSKKNIASAFENDTILQFPNGTILEFEAGTFFPYKIKDINFEVEEVYSLCDMIKNNITTHTEDGNCLISGGMIFVKAIIDTIAIHPVKGKFVRIKVPLQAKVFDKDMQLYVARKDSKGSIKWKYASADLSYVEGNNRYYEFKTDTMMGFNLDKQFMARCEDDGPLVKIPRLKNVKMYLTYKSEIYLSKGFQEKNRVWSLACIDSSKVPVLTVTGEKKGVPYFASGPLLNLKYKKKKKMFVLPKKYLFKRKDFINKNSGTPETELCNNLFETTPKTP